VHKNRLKTSFNVPIFIDKPFEMKGIEVKALPLTPHLAISSSFIPYVFAFSRQG
jgi:hypothetical protein